MNQSTTDRTKAQWEPPGPGTWEADRSHGPPNPTPLFRRLGAEGTAPAYRGAMREFGAPIETIDMQFVNGQLYRRIVPLVGAKFDRGTPPPALVIKALTRIHPAFRREERQAKRTIETKSYLEGIRHWNEVDRAIWDAENRKLQAIDPAELDDDGLAGHLGVLDDFMQRGWHRHHTLHAYDLGPIGDLMAHSQGWGLDTTAVMSLLQGSSPATVAAAKHADAIAAALRGAGVDPLSIDSVEAIRTVPAASAALDTYLDSFGWRVVVGYDIDGPTLNELPAAICAAVRAAAAKAHELPDTSEVYAGLRDECPEPDLFDELVTEARAAYGVRDDNGPLTVAWPFGLMRRSYLEAGRRLHESNNLIDPDHVFELDVAELSALVRNPAVGASASELADRAAHRDWEGTLHGPDHLGAAPVVPDVEPLPPSLRRMMNIVLAASSLLEANSNASTNSLDGVGIGKESYTGRACIVDDAIDAMERLQPGDVLVAPFTAPSFNAVLPIAGAIVVQEGGLLCHAAVLARELDTPAVIGVQGAMTAISNGDQITVDPAAGTVRLVAN